MKGGFPIKFQVLAWWHTIKLFDLRTINMLQLTCNKYMSHFRIHDFLCFSFERAAMKTQHFANI